MHRVIRGVDVQETQSGTVLENVDGNFPQPIVYLATVYVRRRAVALRPLRRRRLRGHGDLSAPSQEMYGFYFAGQQRRSYASARCRLNDGRHANEIGAFHVIGLARLFIEIGVPRDAVFFGPCATTNGRIVGIRYGWKNRTDAPKKTSLGHQAERRKRTRFEIIHAKSIVHTDNDSLLSNEGHNVSPPRIILFHPLASRRAAVFVREATKR